MADRNWWEDKEQLRLLHERLTAINMDRRHFLQVVGAAGGSAAVALALEACGSSASSSTATSSTGGGSGSTSTTTSSSTSTTTTQGSPSASGSSTTAATGNLAADQTLTLNATIEPLSFDFNQNLYCEGDAAVWALLLQFDPLLQVKPDIAEKYEANSDNSVWTFHIRTDSKWTDGTPVTANDFEYSFKRQLDPATKANYAGFLYDLKNAQAFNTGKAGVTANDVGVKAQDAQTLVCTLEGPRGYFPVLVAYTSAAPAYKPAVEKYGDKWTEAANIVCNGPFKLTQWQHNKSYQLKKNDNYWNAKNVTLETINLPIIDTTAEFGAYQNNEIDMAFHGAIGNLAKVQSDATLKKEYFKYNLQGTWYLQPSVKHKPFDNKQVRLAMNHAIDRDTICKEVLKGLGTPAYTMISPGMPGYDPNHYDQYTKYDPELAKSLLKGTPYEGGKNWPSITITMRNNEGDGPQIAAQAISAMLGQNLGMNNVQVHPGDPTTTYQAMYNHTIQLMWIRWYIDYPDPNDDMYLVWYSHLTTGQRSDWSNDQFDKLISDAAALPNGAARWQKYYQADQIMLADGAATFVYNPYNYGLMKPYIAGMPKDQDGNYVPSWNVFVRMYDYLKILKH